MGHRDGNGWITCGLGHRHWGRHGAAGLLVAAPGAGGEPAVLLVRRARWSQHGGTWAPPGGAADSHETPAQAAVREATEECGVEAAGLTVHAVAADDHGGWAYRTFIAAAPKALPVRAASWEVTEAAWVAAQDVARLALHPAFAASWPMLRDALDPVALIVDGANVMGSRPDGWWRDRAAAMAGLYRDLAGLARAGLSHLPDEAGAVTLERWFPDVVLVVEGRSRAALRAAADGGRLRAVAAPGEGDDTIADLAARLTGRRIVVTADRQLRRRCLAAGAAVTGPRWLTGLL